MITSAQKLFEKAEAHARQRRERVWVERNTDGDKYLRIKADEGYLYDIPFSRMKTPAQVLDWIHQVIIAKNWGREMALEILDAIFEDAIPAEMWSGEA